MKTMSYQRKNIDNTVIDFNSNHQPEITNNYSFSDCAKAGLAIAGTVGTVALVKTAGFLPSFRLDSDEIISDNTFDNKNQLINPQKSQIFANNNFPIHTRHAKRSFGKEFQIGYPGSPAIAALSTGDFVVVWESNGQDGDSFGVYGQRFSSTGMPQGNEFQINTYTTNRQGDPSVATLSTGDFVVVWNSNGQDGNSTAIYAQRFSSTGVSQNGEFQVNTYTTGSQMYPSVAGLSTGDFVVVWESDGQDASGYGIYGQRFSSTGMPQGNEFQINTYTTNRQGDPSVATLSTGDFVVVWISYGQNGDWSGIYGQRFSNTGTPQGAEFHANTYAISGQMEPSVAGLTTSDFVVTWTSHLQDGDSWGIYGQRFSNTGTPQGAEFRANTHTPFEQSEPSAAGLTTGGFVVTWASSNNQDGDRKGVYGQCFSSTGVPQGSEFQINTYTSGSQNSPSVTTLNSGDFVVAWRGGGSRHGWAYLFNAANYNEYFTCESRRNGCFKLHHVLCNRCR